MNIDLIVYSLLIRDPHRHDSGYHQSTSWSQRRYGVDHRVRSPRQTHRYDVVQDLVLYHHGSGLAIHFGLQARSLHEVASSNHVLGTDPGSRHSRHYSTRRSILDVL